MAGPGPGNKARRRADAAMVAAYHEARLADLLEHVRAGVGDYDAGRVDAFGLDNLVHQYKRAADGLWRFCAVSGSDVAVVARMLELWSRDNHDRDNQDRDNHARDDHARDNQGRDNQDRDNHDRDNQDPHDREPDWWESGAPRRRDG